MSPTYQDVESAIAGVAGVAEASVRAKDGSSRGRLRIRLAPGHDPDVVSREVAGLLRERFGIDIDPAAIRPKPAEPAHDEPPVTDAADDTSRDDAVGEDAPAAEDAVSEDAPAAEDAVAEDAPAAEDAVAEDAPAAEDAVAEDAAEDAGETREEPAGEPATVGAAAEPPAKAARADLPGVDELFRPTAREHGTAATGNGNGDGHRDGPSRTFHRPLIRDLALGSRGLEIHAEVLLDVDGTEVRGSATGPATRRSTFRAIARATLDAVETMFPGDVKTELESIELDDDGEDERVTVTVTFLTEDGADKLIGASISRGDAEQAVMRATLDAVNRRVGLLLED